MVGSDSTSRVITGVAGTRAVSSEGVAVATSSPRADCVEGSVESMGETREYWISAIYLPRLTRQADGLPPLRMAQQSSI